MAVQIVMYSKQHLQDVLDMAAVLSQSLALFRLNCVCRRLLQWHFEELRTLCTRRIYQGRLLNCNLEVFQRHSRGINDLFASLCS